MQRIAHGELGRTIAARVNAGLAEVPPRLATGLELYRLVVDYYKTNRTADTIFRQGDLQRVCLNDRKNGNLEKFQNDWNLVLDSIDVEISDDVQAYFLFEAIKDHVELQVGINHYKRIEIHTMKDGSKHPDRCLASRFL